MTAELDAVLDRYGLTRRGTAAPLAGGADNTTVRVPTDRGDVVVRRYLRPGVVGVRTELRFVEALARNGFPTPGPLRTVGGERLVPGTEPVAVFPFVAGSVPSTMTADLAVRCGRLLARLHTEAPDIPVPSIDRASLLRKAIAAPTDLDGADAWHEATADFLASARLADLDALPSGPLHHDLHRHNLLVADGEITALLDFGELNHGPLILDLARAFHYLAVDRDDFTLPRELADAMLAGYGEVRVLSGDERGLLQVGLDLVGLVDAAEFLVEHAPGLGYGSVESCFSWRGFLACRGVLG